jgi:predicted permease
MMSTIRGLVARISGVFKNRRNAEREMEQEFQSHLQMQIEDNLRSGMSAEEARRQALLESGSLATAREAHRDQRGLPFLETLMQDVRFGARLLRKSPGFTFVAVLTLALGIGANTAIFSVVNAVLLARLPVKEPNRLVQLWETEVSPGQFPFSGLDYMDWQAQNRTLESSALYANPTAANGSHNGQSQPVLVMRTQATYFSTLGVNAQFGRTFAPGDDQPRSPHVVVLSYGYWQKSFAGREEVLNNTLDLDNEKYAIIGVMPPWFRFPAQAEVFVPLVMTEEVLGHRGTHGYPAIARLKPGVTVAQAEADLKTVAARLEKQYPNSNDHVSAVVIPLSEQIAGQSRQRLLLLLAAVGAVLLLACANVANLLLARASSRQKEMSLRTVLGASRMRVVRQLLTESLMLSLGGGIIGLAGGFWLVRLIEASRQLPLPRYNPVRIDAPVLLFTFALSVLVGIVFGLAPIFQTAKMDLGEELKSTSQTVMNASRFTRWLRDGLVVLELSVSLSLLIVAGLLLRSFARLQHTDIGVDPHNVFTGFVMLPDSKYPSLQARRQFTDRFAHEVSLLPGVKSAAFSTEIPLEGGWNGTLEVPGDTNPAHKQQLVEYNFVTPDYFRTMGIPLKRGRIFNEQEMDRAAEVDQKIDEIFKRNPKLEGVPSDLSYVAVINAAMARMFWPTQDAVGKVFKYNGVMVTVLGVVGDVKQWGIRAETIPQAYYPLTLNQSAPRFGAILTIKTSGPPEAIVPSVREKLHDIDELLAIYAPRSMEKVIARDITDATLETWLFGSLAALALVLAAVGLYSVLAYLVSQRTREIGIRMALGARHGHVLNLVMRHAALLISVGIFLGLAWALLATRAMADMLFGVTAHDPVTFAAVVSILTLVALAACLIPVRRATRVDPMVALRYE